MKITKLSANVKVEFFGGEHNRNLATYMTS